jgi:flagellar biosynthetic protein FlhB
MAENKTEKATPKKREEARKKGQVARSVDVNGAVVLIASLLALSAFAARIVDQCKLALLQVLELAKTPQVVDQKGIGTLFVLVGEHVLLAAAPVMFVCMVAGLVASAGQVGLKPTFTAITPDAKKLNPMSGLKNLFNPQHFAVETTKNVVKVVAVGAIVALAVYPRLDELGSLVGMSPQDLIPEIGGMVMTIAQRAAVAYLAIAGADYFWQRYKHEKSLKMDKEEIKQEFKQMQLPAEIKSAQRRRAMELSRARMMDAVPTADVIVTNPTHYSVALKYDSGSAAPVVVAKGVDNLAFKIREIARAHDIPIVENVPLARALYATVEIDQEIPTEHYHAVAEVIGYVMRLRRGVTGLG